MDRTFEVVFNFSNNVDRFTVDYGDKVNASDVQQMPSKVGYTFEWNTKADGTGEVFNPSEEVLSDFEVYPFYRINTFEVTFDNDGVSTKINVNNNDKINKADIPSTDKAGYTLIGWLNTDTNKYNDFDTELVTANLTLKAVYEKNAVPVNPNDNTLLKQVLIIM